MRIPAPGHTIQEAKEYLRENYKDGGVDCPCCGQLVKMYKRAITTCMAGALVYLARSRQTDFVHVRQMLETQDAPRAIKQDGDFAKLLYWGLVEVDTTDREDGSKRNGRYKITSKGKQFVTGAISVPKYALVYNGKFFGHEGEEMTIQQALKNKFDYNTLMGEIINNNKAV